MNAVDRVAGRPPLPPAPPVPGAAQAAVSAVSAPVDPALPGRPAHVVPVGDTPPLPVGLQREQLRPPVPPLMTREQMVALLDAMVNGPPGPALSGQPLPQPPPEAPGRGEAGRA